MLVKELCVVFLDLDSASDNICDLKKLYIALSMLGSTIT